tara:strand:- start:125 stop:409 length:285 start_codon:yes stop_codon:yes gene_type:complete
MLQNLNRQNWASSLKRKDYEKQQDSTVEMMEKYKKLTSDYNKWIQEENKVKLKEFNVQSVGKMNPKKHLISNIEDTMNENVMECLGTMINTVVF